MKHRENPHDGALGSRSPQIPPNILPETPPPKQNNLHDHRHPFRPPHRRQPRQIFLPDIRPSPPPTPPPLPATSQNPRHNSTSKSPVTDSLHRVHSPTPLPTPIHSGTSQHALNASEPPDEKEKDRSQEERPESRITFLSRLNFTPPAIQRPFLTASATNTQTSTPTLYKRPAPHPPNASLINISILIIFAPPTRSSSTLPRLVANLRSPPRHSKLSSRPPRTRPTPSGYGRLTQSPQYPRLVANLRSPPRHSKLSSRPPRTRPTPYGCGRLTQSPQY